MKILVIGGSYFLGRVFVMSAEKEHEITVVNRGSQPLAGLKVTEIHGDRHEAGTWEQCGEAYDVLVDFCAYREGDIRTVIEHLKGSVKQYIFISTVDVYEHGKPGMKDETTPFETACFEGHAGDYITGKVALERELVEACAPRGIQTTVLRPAFIYGPLNYAPRETVFIQLMARDGILPVVTGADGQFRFLYVKDGADAILKCLLNPSAYGQAYNLCGDEIADYRMLADVLKKGARELVAQELEEGDTAGAQNGQEQGNGQEQENRQNQENRQDQRNEQDRRNGQDPQNGLQEIEISAAQAESQGFPLPFPVTASESHLCSNEKSKRELGMSYTSLEAGMEKTCRAFWNVFR